jgi:tripartite-type tricarboxylate transporter receptor subunit TctC
MPFRNRFGRGASVAERCAARCTKDPELNKRREGLGITVVSDARVEPAAHRKFVEGEVARWAKVIQAAGTYAD